jgi:squalene-hopene/tetraprenyl-beta-curcumene cyclase
MSPKAELQSQAATPARSRGTVLDLIIKRACAFLMSRQHEEGYWIAELEADTTLESDYITYLHIIGKFDSTRVAKLATYIRQRQLADGGWNIYVGGPSEVNATVKAYLALRLAGDSAQAEHMVRACGRVRALGGLEKTNSFTRFYLALLGLVKWNMVPAVPPELMFMPSWARINIYEMSSWTRAIVIPLTILYGRKPCWPVPSNIRVEELFSDPSRKTSAFDFGPGISWRNFFLMLDRILKAYDRLPWKPGRERAMRRASEWMLEHLNRSDGLAAIYPAMMNSVYALMALGNGPDHPMTAREIAELGRFEIEETETIRMQPCLPPVWDTAIAAYALVEADIEPNDPALEKTARWLLDNQITGPGDWQIKNRDAVPGGWAFEFRNDFYPDVDDTAFVLMALERIRFSDPVRMSEAIRRGTSWMVSMQNKDGGWAAFDRDNNRAILNHIPFADHNAMLDPSSPDLTARVLECLGQFGWNASNPRIRKAIQYLVKEQTPAGAWYGRWGVNYIYGTSGVLRALTSVGATAGPATARAIEWLRSVQNPDGGFGESCATYDNPSTMGQGDSTPSQTAWGLLGLLTAASPDDPAVQRAVDYLIKYQNTDGSWDERPFTGTGFPKVFYLKYHYYRHYFPLYALARYRRMLQNRYRPGRIS